MGMIAWSCLSVSCLSFLAASAAAQPSLSWRYKFVTLDYPGAPVTYPLGINASREIAGSYLDANGLQHGFLYSGGKFTRIDFPGGLMTPGKGTGAGGINDRGVVTGTYFDQQGFQHGFLWMRPEGCDHDDDDRCKPVFSTIDVPGAVKTQGIDFELGTGLGTASIGINNHQDVVGMYAKTSLYSAGFVLSGGHYRSIENPAEGHTAAMGTKLFGINDYGVIVGDYMVQPDPTLPSITHGFVLEGSTFTPVYVAGSEQGGFGTQANGINIHREVVGIFSDPQGNGHGLFWAGGQAFTLDFPGSLFSEAHTINAQGDITGAYATDPTGNTIHGFVAYPKDGDGQDH